MNKGEESSNDERFFPEPKIHDYLCKGNIIAGNPEIAPAIHLGNIPLGDIDILFTLKTAKEHCKKECNMLTCKQIIKLFDTKKREKAEPTLY